MGLIERAKSLFSNLGKRPQLQSSVVRHDRIDDSYLDDFRAKATKFQEVYEGAPNVPLGTPPEKCPHCGTDEPEWQTHGKQILCSSCQTQVAMPEGPYSPWSDLVSDAFRAYFTYNEPATVGQGEVKESHELNRRIMSRIVNSDEMLDTRPITRMNEFESAFSAMALVTGLHDEIYQGSLRPHAQRAQEMAQYEDTLENIERKLQQMRDAIDNDPDSVDQGDLQQLLDAHDQTSGKLAVVVAQQQQSPLGLDVAQAVDLAAQQAQDDANTISAMPGMGGGGGGARIQPDMMFALAERWRQSEVLRKVAELLGRLERDMRFKRANRVVGGFEEVVDVELGDNIALALPHELAKLGHPLLKLDFLRRYHEQGIAQYEMRGNEPEGKGPTLITVDESYSMSGDRIVWAKAVALALVNLAHKENRDAGIICYSDETDANGHGIVEAFFFPARGELDIEAVLDVASHNFQGGTDATPAVAHAKRVMEDVPEFRKADLVMITDGEDYFGDEDRDLRDAMRARGVRIHGVGIGGSFGYLGEMCDHVIHVADLTLSEGVNDATDHLAVAIS